MYEELKRVRKKDIKKAGANVLIMGNRCYRCGYEWVSRKKDEVPTVCPSCKSPYWDRPRRKCKGNAKS